MFATLQHIDTSQRCRATKFIQKRKESFWTKKNYLPVTHGSYPCEIWRSLLIRNHHRTSRHTHMCHVTHLHLAMLLRGKIHSHAKKKNSHVIHGAYPCGTWRILIRDTLYTLQLAVACNTWLLFVILATFRNIHCHLTRSSTWHILIDMTHSYKWSFSCDTFL